MFWEDDKQDNEAFVVPDDIVDVSFRIHCKCLPLDHALGLYSALSGVLPWWVEETRGGAHLIHGAESGNGWIRPSDPDALLYLSRRTRMTLRLPKERVESVRRLEGSTLDVDGYAITLGAPKTQPLSTLTTLFARHVVMDSDSDEREFLRRAALQLGNLGVQVKKMLGGREHRLALPEGTVSTRSLMLDGMEVSDSIRLQQEGLGPGRKFGCGLFLPHKGIDAVARPPTNIDSTQ